MKTKVIYYLKGLNENNNNFHVLQILFSISSGWFYEFKKKIMKKMLHAMLFAKAVYTIYATAIYKVNDDLNDAYLLVCLL